MPDYLPMEPTRGTPLRLSEIKYAVYGGLKLNRILLAGWSLQPSIGLVAKDIQRLGLGIRSFREPLERAIRHVMMPSIKKNFLAEGRPDRWEPLAPYTVQVRGDSYPILYRSGSLMRAAGSFRIWTITETSATIRDLPPHVWYGKLHQSGYGSLEHRARKQLGLFASAAQIRERIGELFQSAGSGEPGSGRGETKFVIPQREFIMFQDEDIDAIQEIFVEWMEELADSVGRGWSTRR